VEREGLSHYLRHYHETLAQKPFHAATHPPGLPLTFVALRAIARHPLLQRWTPLDDATLAGIRQLWRKVLPLPDPKQDTQILADWELKAAWWGAFLCVLARLPCFHPLGLAALAVRFRRIQKRRRRPCCHDPRYPLVAANGGQPTLVSHHCHDGRRRPMAASSLLDLGDGDGLAGWVGVVDSLQKRFSPRCPFFVASLECPHKFGQLAPPLNFQTGKLANRQVGKW